MSPIDMSREIVETLTDNEFIRSKLHTCICHELTAKQIKELYKEVKYIYCLSNLKFENSNQLKLNI